MTDRTVAGIECEDFVEALLVLRSVNGDEGLDAVRDVLDMIHADGIAERGYLRHVAGELRAVGVRDIADIVAEAAKRAKPGPPNFAERLAARERAKRRAARTEAKAKA
jgi:hypothetical protein